MYFCYHEHKKRASTRFPDTCPVLLNYQLLLFIPRRLPARRLMVTEYQYITSRMGNIWETL